MNSKRKGNRNEYKSMDFYESKGFKCTRSAASLGVWDFIGLSNNKIVLVQVKSNRKPAKKEMLELKSFPNIYCEKCGNKVSDKLLHVWEDYKRKPNIHGIGEDMDNFKILDYWYNAYTSNVVFKLKKDGVVYIFELYCEDFNINNVKPEVEDFKNLSLDEFKSKYKGKYDIYSLS